MRVWLRITATDRRADSICRSARHSPLHAALRLPRTGAAARADDARRRVERLGDPLDIEHLRGRANAGGGLLRNHTIAAAATISSPSKPWASLRSTLQLLLGAEIGSEANRATLGC